LALAAVTSGTTEMESMAVIGMFLALVIFTIVRPEDIEELRDYRDRLFK